MSRQAKSGVPFGKIWYTRCRNWASPLQKSGTPNLSAGTTDGSDNDADESNGNDADDGADKGQEGLIAI